MPILMFRPLPTCFLGLFGDGSWQGPATQAMAPRSEWLVDSFGPDPRDLAPDAPASVRVFVFAGPFDSPLWAALVNDWLPCLRQLGHTVIFLGVESRWPRESPGRHRLVQKIRRGGGLLLSVPPLAGPSSGPHAQLLQSLLLLLTLLLESLNTRSLERFQSVLDEGRGCRWFLGMSPQSGLEALESAALTRLEGLEPKYLWALLSTPPGAGSDIQAQGCLDALQEVFYRDTDVQVFQAEHAPEEFRLLALLWP